MPDVLSLELTNCYGIREFKEELEFKHKGLAIYAPNGVMKTSFANTMMDLSIGKEPSDHAFPDRESRCDVKLNGETINEDEIFVVKSYDEGYPSDEVSTLLANESLKKRYEKVHKDIALAKKELETNLRILAGYGEKSREKIDPIIEDVFEDQYYDALLGLEAEVSDSKDESYGNADYKIIFNSKVVQLLKTAGLGEIVEDFAKKYSELTESSPILRSEFQFHNVNQVQQQLKTNKFFDVGHSINLSDEENGEKQEFTSNESFLKKIEEEKNRVINDQNLIKKFDKFNAKLKNKDLEAFRDYITINKHLLQELQDLDSFKRKLWIQYIYKSKESYNLLVSRYKEGQEELANIVSEARGDPNDWDDVVEDFNRRFTHLPYRLSVENKPDVILKGTAPSINFNFVDGDDVRTYSNSQKNDLIRILSTGEARALYILNH